MLMYSMSFPFLPPSKHWNQEVWDAMHSMDPAGSDAMTLEAPPYTFHQYGIIRSDPVN